MSVRHHPAVIHERSDRIPLVFDEETALFNACIQDAGLGVVVQFLGNADVDAGVFLLRKMVDGQPLVIMTVPREAVEVLASVLEGWLDATEHREGHP